MKRGDVSLWAGRAVLAGLVAVATFAWVMTLYSCIAGVLR